MTTCMLVYAHYPQQDHVKTAIDTSITRPMFVASACTQAPSARTHIRVLARRKTEGYVNVKVPGSSLPSPSGKQGRTASAARLRYIPTRHLSAQLLPTRF